MGLFSGNSTSNPPGTTQTANGQVLNGRPVMDHSRGHLMPAGHDSSSQPQHFDARSGNAGHQR